MTHSEIANLRLLASAADKAKRNVLARLQLQRSIKQRIERMTRTVVARVHNDEPIAQPVFAAKRFPALNRKLDRIVVGPRRNNCDSPRVAAFSKHPIAHEAVQHDRPRRVFQAIAQHPLETPRRNRTLSEPTRRKRFIRIEIHYPETERSAFQPHKQCAEKGDQRRRRQRLLDGVDVVVDGADNFPARYLLNDACVKLGKPLVYGAVQSEANFLGRTRRSSLRSRL